MEIFSVFLDAMFSERASSGTYQQLKGDEEYQQTDRELREQTRQFCDRLPMAEHKALFQLENLQNSMHATEVDTAYLLGITDCIALLKRLEIL